MGRRIADNSKSTNRRVETAWHMKQGRLPKNLTQPPLWTPTVLQLQKLMLIQAEAKLKHPKWPSKNWVSLKTKQQIARTFDFSAKGCFLMASKTDEIRANFMCGHIGISWKRTIWTMTRAPRDMFIRYTKKRIAYKWIYKVAWRTRFGCWL